VALISPWTYTAADTAGNVLSVTFTFDNTLFTILTITGHKDAGCAYNNFYMSVGGDGRPESTATQLAVAQGDTLIAVATVNGMGLTTITDVLANQVTAGP